MFIPVSIGIGNWTPITPESGSFLHADLHASSDGGAVAGATVDITVTNTVTNAAKGTRTLSTVTDVAGIASFRWANAPSGDYLVEIMKVQKDGMVHDAFYDNLSGAFFTLP